MNTTTNTPTTKVELTEYRPGRNIIHIGDPVKVRPPHSSTSFKTTVRRITDTPYGLEVEVIDPRFGHFRTVRPECITRLAVSRNQDKVAS
jgi:hypothetical protein